MSSNSSIYLRNVYPLGITAPFELASELQRILGKAKLVRGAPPARLPRFAIQGLPREGHDRHLEAR